MKKAISLLLIVIIFTLTLLCLSVACAESQASDGLGVKYTFETGKGTFHFTVDDVVIIKGDSYADYLASQRGNDIIILGVLGVLENENYKRNDNDDRIISDEIANYFEVTDQDGFSLEFTNYFSGGVGKYEGGADVRINAKKRVLIPYYATEGIDKVNICFGDNVFSVSLSDTADKTNNAAQTTLDEAIAAKEELEKKVTELENQIASLEKQLEDATASSQQQNEQKETTIPTEKPTAKPTTKPTEKPNQQILNSDERDELLRMFQGVDTNGDGILDMDELFNNGSH